MPPAPFTREVNARGDRAHVLAGAGLRRAGGRPLELYEQPGQAGLKGRGCSGRKSRPHACSSVHTGRAHVLRPQLRAVLVCRVPDGFGPRVFVCALSELCSWLGVSGMAVQRTCGLR